MSRAELSIRDGEQSEFDLDVSISGISADAKPNVRFVIESVNGHNISIDCVHATGVKWRVVVPALSIAEAECQFHVEVITEGFYFVPKRGLIKVDHVPKVNLLKVVEAIETKKNITVEAAVSSSPVPVTDDRDVVDYNRLTESQQETFTQQCVRGATILSKVGKMLETVAHSETSRKGMSNRNLAKLLRSVQESTASILSAIKA